MGRASSAEQDAPYEDKGASVDTANDQSTTADSPAPAPVPVATSKTPVADVVVDDSSAPDDGPVRLRVASRGTNFFTTEIEGVAYSITDEPHGTEVPAEVVEALVQSGIDSGVLLAVTESQPGGASKSVFDASDLMTEEDKTKTVDPTETEEN